MIKPRRSLITWTGDELETYELCRTGGHVIIATCDLTAAETAASNRYYQENACPNIFWRKKQTRTYKLS